MMAGSTDSLSASIRIRRRVWKIAIGFLAVYLTFFVGNFFLSSDRAISSHAVGHDFMAFYTAGSFLKEGREGDLYDLSAVRQFQKELAVKENLEVGSSFGPWWNPPFYAWVFVPLAELSYRQALTVWELINAAALAAAVVLLCRMMGARDAAGRLPEAYAYERRLTPEDMPELGWKTWLLVPVCILAAPPFVQALTHAQNTFGSLLILCIAVTLWRQRRAMTAGLAAGLLLYKPQLGAVVAMAMIFDLGPRALVGFAASGALLLGITLNTLPQALMDYIQQLSANLHYMQIENEYLWERHVTLKSFWRLLLQGREAGEPWPLTTILTYASLSAVGLGLAIRALQWKKRLLTDRPAALSAGASDPLICATIVAMPLLMPFYFDYDLLLLAVPVALLARDMRIKLHQEGKSARLPKLDASIAIFISLLYFWPHFNPAVGKLLHINLTVLILSSLWFLCNRRLGRTTSQISTQPSVITAKVMAKAA